MADGAGYDIGLAGSAANSFSTPQNTAAGTVFNFSSPGSSGDTYNQTQTSTADAAASASAKSPGSDQAASFGSPASSINPAMIYVVAGIAGIALLAAGISAYAVLRK